MSNFGFLQTEWPELFQEASKSESFVYPDARSACFYSRRTLELVVAWLYQYDRLLKPPYQDNLNALLHEPTFKSTLGPTLWVKTKIIKDLGNIAVHSHDHIAG